MIKVTGFILRIIQNKDDSKIVIIYTRELGKITVVAYIPEKVNSIALSSYEVGNAVELVLYRKKENDMYTVSQITLIKQYSNIRFNYDKYLLLIYMMQTILKNIEENLPDKEFMNFLKLYINFLNKLEIVEEEKIKFLFDFYFLRIHGLLPELICKTEEDIVLIDNLTKQVVLNEEIFPYISKNLIKQIIKVKNSLTIG